MKSLHCAFFAASTTSSCVASRIAETDIVFDRIVEQVDVSERPLKYVSGGLSAVQSFTFSPPTRTSPFLNVPESCNQIAKGCLSAAGRSDNGAGTALRHFERNVVDYGTAVIGEGYIPKFNVKAVGLKRQLCCVPYPGYR